MPEHFTPADADHSAIRALPRRYAPSRLIALAVLASSLMLLSGCGLSCQASGTSSYGGGTCSRSMAHW